jgi:Tfp pilus assembly protein PilV
MYVYGGSVRPELAKLQAYGKLLRTAVHSHCVDAAYGHAASIYGCLVQEKWRVQLNLEFACWQQHCAAAAAFSCSVCRIPNC